MRQNEEGGRSSVVFLPGGGCRSSRHRPRCTWHMAVSWHVQFPLPRRPTERVPCGGVRREAAACIPRAPRAAQVGVLVHDRTRHSWCVWGVGLSLAFFSGWGGVTASRAPPPLFGVGCCWDWTVLVVRSCLLMCLGSVRFLALVLSYVVFSGHRYPSASDRHSLKAVTQSAKQCGIR